MATFTCTIELDNAAFHEDPYELRHLVEKTALKVGSYFPLTDGLQVHSVILDTNGNRVGSWRIE